VDWSELERRQPALAGLGRRRLLDPGVVLVATIRAERRSPGAVPQAGTRAA